MLLVFLLDLVIKPGPEPVTIGIPIRQLMSLFHFLFLAVFAALVPSNPVALLYDLLLLLLSGFTGVLFVFFYHLLFCSLITDCV